jgi:hypothetical protein
MRTHHLDLGCVVLEVRADLFALELVVLVSPHGHSGAKRFERASQALRAGPKRQRVAPGRQLERPPFDDGDAVFRVIVAIAGADVRFFACPSRTNGRESTSRVRIGYGTERRFKII